VCCRVGRVDRGRAEDLDAVTQVCGAHARHDRGACRNSELHSCHAYPTRRAVDEHPLSGPELALGEQGVIRDRERLREAGGLQRGDLVGHGQSGSFVNGHQLGLRSASDHRHDPIADDETFGTRTNCRHNARELEARDVGRPTRRCRVQAGPLQQVGPVQARSLNPDQQFASARDRVGSLRYDYCSRLDDDSAHF
jgi:hypothetical protein